MSHLQTAALSLLQQRPRTITYKTIQDATGLHPDWLACFAQQKFADPGVGKVEKLYVYLSGKTLKL